MRVLIVLLLVASTAFAQTVKTKLNGNEIVVEGTTPSAKIGDNLRVEVSNVTANQVSTWTFLLDGQSMTEKTVNNVIGYEGKVASTPYTVTFQDTASQVTILGDSINGPEPAAQPSAAANSQAFLRTYDRARDNVNLYLLPNGALTHGNIPRDIDDNDTITVYLYATDAEAEKLSVAVDGTFSSADTYEVLGGSAIAGFKDLSAKLTADEKSKPHIIPGGTFGPYASPSITLKLNKQSADGKSTETIRQYAIRINKTYLASVALLGGRSSTAFNDFHLSPSKADATKNVITNSADTKGDTRYLLSVTPYAWQLWRAANWRGRDVGKPPMLLDRINPTIAVGVKAPTKEYLIGASFELARGVQIVYGIHRAKVKQLTNGYAEGDVFTGAENTIPTREVWSKNEHLLGVAVDLRVATQLLSGLLH